MLRSAIIVLRNISWATVRPLLVPQRERGIAWDPPPHPEGSPASYISLHACRRPRGYLSTSWWAPQPLWSFCHIIPPHTCACRTGPRPSLFLPFSPPDVRLFGPSTTILANVSAASSPLSNRDFVFRVGVVGIVSCLREPRNPRPNTVCY